MSARVALAVAGSAALWGAYSWWGANLARHRRPEYAQLGSTSGGTTYYQATSSGDGAARPSLAAFQHLPVFNNARGAEADKDEGRTLSCDVCVVGGGFAGLHTALELRERGLSVVVLEAERVGWGPSGMNCGMAIAGFMREGMDFVNACGSEEAARLWYGRSVEAQQLLLDRIERYGISADVNQCGLLTASNFPQDEKECKRDVEDFNTVMKPLEGVQPLQFWSGKQVRERVRSAALHHGVFDAASFSVNPLRLVRGLASALESVGGQLFEHSRVTSLQRITIAEDKERWEVSTADGGRLQATYVVLACGAHLDPRIAPELAAATAPVFTYIVATGPLTHEQREMVGEDMMLCDDKYSLNYWRVLDDRLLWGGRAQVLPLSWQELEQRQLQSLSRMFPALGPVEVENMWGGTLAIGWSLMPLIGCIGGTGPYYISGLGGHGIVPSVFAAAMVAEDIVARQRGNADSAPQRPLALYEKQFPLWPPVGNVLGSLAAHVYLQAQSARDGVRQYVGSALYKRRDTSE